MEIVIRWRQSTCFRSHESTRSHHRVFGWSIVVDEHERQCCLRTVMKHVAAGQDRAQRQGRRERLLNHGFGDRRGQEADGDSVLVQPLQEIDRGDACFFVGNVDAGAGGKIRP